ncbi:MAG: hypothetical protein M4579_001136 [Chaenotheca gracillima]|nr:MAG: hypothetical protein M4579_001136 [Chaenotheca gracillima]
MSSSTAILPPPAPAGPNPASPRKRRRRAPTSGAADDCFACRKRQVKCDRRRPYCTQCLNQGKDCSGYKTQLTWGVGVASRGKLRGLSLPVAKKQTPTVTAERPRERRSFSSTAESVESTQPQPSPQIPNERPVETPERTSPEATPHSTGNFMNYDFVNIDPTGLSNSSVAHSPVLECQPPGVFEPYEAIRVPLDTLHNRPYLRQALHLHTPMAGSMEDLALPTSASSNSGYSESDYNSPVDFPQTPDEFSYASSHLPTYGSYHSQHPHAMSYGNLAPFSNERRPTSVPAPYGYSSSMESSISSDAGGFDMIPRHGLSAEQIGPCNLSDILYDDELADGGVSNTNDIELGFGCGTHVRPFTRELLTDEDSFAAAIDSSNNRHSASHIAPTALTCESVPRRIRFLLYHYDKILCPAMTAIDGPGNPYRAHVIPLAMQSESLRCAIGAFSLSNLRRRKRNSILAQERALQRLHALANVSKIGHDEPNGSSNQISSGEAEAQLALIREANRIGTQAVPKEEIDFKRASIQLLNRQFADSSGTKDDAVLATLLILCSYHLCETGVAQFRTQFAGVKKLLGLRKSGVETGIWGWMETLFTWFDAMTATVNDREAQLRGGYLEMVSLAKDLHSLENLAGCDGRLFTIIAKLGRLNMLSQKRPVLDPLDELPRATSLPSPISASSSYPHSLNYYEPNGSTPETASSGNDDEDEDDLMDINDDRPEFWKEWREIRTALRSWNYRTSLTAPEHLLSEALHDLHQISEAFRTAALLYTERLARPLLPSAHPRFQSLVSTTLRYIGRIPVASGVNKFLLWPLFIAGTECVEPAQRSSIRQRCLDIQKESGFFNNISSLEILERLWRDDRAWYENAEGKDLSGTGTNGTKESEGGNPEGTGAGGNAFRWRRAMEEVNGEFCMI